MIDTRRVYIATIVGFVLGFVEWIFAIYPVSFIPETALPWSSWAAALSIISIRTVLGFVIGISAWQMPWGWHGAVLGAILSIPLVFVLVWTHLGWLFSIGGALGEGIALGVVIEWLTSRVFKAPAAIRSKLVSVPRAAVRV